MMELTLTQILEEAFQRGREDTPLFARLESILP
jgi:hypothetical protein